MSDIDGEAIVPGDDAAPVAQETKQSEVPEWVSKELRELRDENKELRQERTRLRLSKQYGDDVIDLVPSSLTLKEQEALAEKLAARLTGGTPNPPAEANKDEVVEEQPDPAAERLAAVAGQAPGSAGQAVVQMSAKEIAALGRTDPVAAQRAIEAQYANGAPQPIQPFRDR